MKKITSQKEKDEIIRQAIIGLQNVGLEFQKKIERHYNHRKKERLFWAGWGCYECYRLKFQEWAKEKYE